MSKYSAPSTANGISWADLKGSLLSVTVHALESGIKTVHGEAQAVRADVLVMDGKDEGKSYIDTLIFPKVLISQTKAAAGKPPVLGRLGQGLAKPGQSAPWTLAAPTAEDFAVAEAFDAKETVTPF